MDHPFSFNINFYENIHFHDIIYIYINICIYFLFISVFFPLYIYNKFFKNVLYYNQRIYNCIELYWKMTVVINNILNLNITINFYIIQKFWVRIESSALAGTMPKINSSIKYVNTWSENRCRLLIMFHCRMKESQWYIPLFCLVANSKRLFIH